MGDGKDEGADSAVKQGVVYALMLPSVRLARVFRVPIKELGDWLQMAYYHELKRQGFKMREASELLDVSMRKVALLSKRLKRNLVEPDSDHGLPRRLEFMLWAGPLSRARVLQALPQEAPEDVERALDLLVEQGRVREVGGRTVTYEVVRSRFRLVQNDLLARLDGLNNLAGNVSGAVYARFFEQNPDAFARTVSLRVRREDIPKLRSLYEDTLWKQLVALDEAAKGDKDALEMDLSIMWAPNDTIDKHIPEEDDP